MINNVTLTGRLTKTPKLETTNSGVQYIKFIIAVERTYTNQNGERKSDFITCVAYRKLAESISNLAVKGSLIGIVGRIQTGSYQNNEGRTVYTTDVVVDNFQMLEPKSVTDQRRQQEAGAENYSAPVQPQNNIQEDSSFNPFEGIDDDDMPF